MQKVIQFKGAAQRTFNIKAWLNETSEFYTQIMDEPVSRGQVLRVHLIIFCMLLAIGAVETSFVVSFLFLIFAGKFTHDLNKHDKKI